MRITNTTKLTELKKMMQTKDKWLNSDLTVRKKRCPKCKKYKHVEFLPVFPMPWQMSASFYCFNCHIYIDENGKEDTNLMEIMLAVVAQEEAEGWA